MACSGPAKTRTAACPPSGAMNNGVSERVRAAFDGMVEKLRVRSLVAVCCLLASPIWAQGHNGDFEVTQPADYASAPREWRRMAEQGQAAAQYNLGIMYEYGRGVRQNDVEAARWYRKASVQGVSVAQYKLGIMYDNGWGVTPSDTEAVRWYRNAAEQGHPLAQHDLAFMYAAGTGVAQSYLRAYMWLNIAVEHGHSLMIIHLNSITEHLTPAQIVKAQKMAREWMVNHQR
jgi:TPR repeat protein